MVAEPAEVQAIARDFCSPCLTFVLEKEFLKHAVEPRALLLASFCTVLCMGEKFYLCYVS